jgi:hypothetical protein
MNFVFLSSRFLSPLDQEHLLDPLVKGSCTRPESLEFSDYDPQPFLTEAHPAREIQTENALPSRISLAAHSAK